MIPNRYVPHLWWLGVHGGAGESSLAALFPGTAAAEHQWQIPLQRGVTQRSVLVARTNLAGMHAVRLAVAQWAAGAVSSDIELVGIVFMADAPGKLPRALRDYLQITASGARRHWLIPWVDPWRLGQPSVSPELELLGQDLHLTSTFPRLKGKTRK